MEAKKVDRLSELPDCLLSQVLSKLTTKDVVKSSVLSTRWRNMWKHVPGLDLCFGDFSDLDVFQSFVDKFLGFNSDSCLEHFELMFDGDYREDCPGTAHFTPWINTVVKREVQKLHIFDYTFEVAWLMEKVEIPETVYTCGSLVSLKLCNVILPHPKFVSLPRLKVMSLEVVQFTNSLAFEMLISGCPILETLTLCSRSDSDKKEVLRVCSQSLLSFTYDVIPVDGIESEDLVVSILAPRLEYLELSDHSIANVVINNNPGSLAKVYLDITFNPSGELDPNDLPRNMIGNFFVVISSVKHMAMSSHTLKMIYDYSRCEQIPLFRNLISLGIHFYDYGWKMLLIFLENCPNLKSLELEFCRNYFEDVTISPGTLKVITSLEYVKLVNLKMKGEAAEMKLITYFLENTTVLKRFTLLVHDLTKEEKSDIVEKLVTIPRRSSSCQIVVL